MAEKTGKNTKSDPSCLHLFVNDIFSLLPSGFILVPTVASLFSSRKVVDANHRERWVSNNMYWELRKNPGFINIEHTVNLW